MCFIIKDQLDRMVPVYYILFIGIVYLQVRGDDLKAVVVLFRHGDRTPIDPYPNDPYRNNSYWPVGFGQLTNKGKEQHFQLGQWFRSRYDGFLPKSYSEEDFYVRSTDVDRTLMSAEANLAGLYPPTDKELWNPDLKWEPIPVHTVPENLDAILAGKKPCAKYQMLHKELEKSDYFKKINHQNHDLFVYLTKNSGCAVADPVKVLYLYTNLFIETLSNFTLPPWASKVFPKKLKPLASLAFAIDTFTPEMARLKTGPFFNYIIDFFHNRTTTDPPNSVKFLMLSAHDSTIANVLNSMGAFEYHCPPFTSTIIFELKKRVDAAHYVNIFYKNTSVPRQIHLTNCSFDCNLVDFVNVLKPITIDSDRWEMECRLEGAFAWPLTFQWNIILICCLLTVILLLSAVIAGVRKSKKECDNNYIQLPNEEYA